MLVLRSYARQFPIHSRASRPRASHPRRGTAAVEFAVVLPLIVTLLLGTWEMGRYIEIQQIVCEAAREGGRQVCSGKMTNAQVITNVKNFMKIAGLPASNVTVTVSDLTNPGLDATAAVALDQMKVNVSIPFKDVRWTPLKLVTNDTSLVTAYTIWYSAVPVSYPDSVGSPLGN